MTLARKARKCLSGLEDFGLRRSKTVPSGSYSVGEGISIPNVGPDPVCESSISSAGGVLLSQTIRAAGLDRGLPEALSPWRRPTAVHDPGKVLLDIATVIGLGGDCLADVAGVRAQSALFGRVASDLTVSRVIGLLAADADTVLPALQAAHVDARARVWARCRTLVGQAGSRDGGQVIIIDIDATWSPRTRARNVRANLQTRFRGFAPMCAFVDHGPTGTGETLALDL